MSGNYGWGGRDRSDDYSDNYGTGYSGAYRSYNSTSKSSYVRSTNTNPNTYADDYSDYVAPATPVVNVSVVKKVAPTISLDPKGLKLKSTADNVIIVGLDVTGSMGEWRQEILNRLALLYGEAQKYLGNSLEILFIGFGDHRYNDKIEVTRFGSDKILDSYLASLDLNAWGGGNRVESPEMVAAYVATSVDTSSAKNVYFYLITDEGIDTNIDANAFKNLFGECEQIPADTKKTFESLFIRMKVFCVFAITNSYGTDATDSIRAEWDNMLGKQRVLALDDSRRVVDVMLGSLSKTVGKYDTFTADLNTRQGGTVYGDVNIATVHKTIALVDDGSPATPKLPSGGGTKRLLP